MLPKGFYCGGIHSGIAKKAEKKDLAVFFSKLPAKAAGMFTANFVKAAPVLLSQKKLKNNKSDFQAIVANSGNANACTGTKGLRDAETICNKAAELLGLKSASVLNASTGVIGQDLPVAKITKALPGLIGKLGNSGSAELSAVKAIMTTDVFPKISSRAVILGGKKVTVWGCAKGAGMIHPALAKAHATMLSFILTDANISGGALEKVLSSSVERSFNCVSVDGDTSTNDTVLVLANGAAENPPVRDSGRGFELFSKAFGEVCLALAKMIARDGEGATKLIDLEVKNARTAQDAKKIASTVATSPLFKTAIFGNDANWGRIMAALGRAGVKVNPGSIDIRIGGILVAKNGQSADFSESKAKQALKKKEVKVSVDLKAGKESAKYYTCDFSFDYIKINASYRS